MKYERPGYGPAVQRPYAGPNGGKPDGHPEQEGDLELAERTRSELPRRYQVVFHNDDYTPMEFVVQVLMHFFHKDESEATYLMLEVHHKGAAVAGIYSRDVAETKVSQVMGRAREQGHPLLCTAEPEGYEG
jgi:ATP-dependent Clp protease adaptor protein ClpS